MIIQPPRSVAGEAIKAGISNHGADRSEATTPILGRNNRTTRGSWPIMPKMRFVQESEGMPFSGTAYVAGFKTTGLGTKKWVRCKLDTGAAMDDDGDPPNPFPPNEEWYEVAKTSGDIHESRA